MTRRTAHGVFRSEDEVVRAAEAARKAGWEIVDIYAPYAAHETFRALGLAPSRLPIAAFVFGFLGTAFAFWFQHWTSAADWPLNVGGRPWNSWPAFVPVAFEMMVLCAGIGSALTWLAASRLYPGKTPKLPEASATDDAFVLEVRERSGTLDAEELQKLFRECRHRGPEESVMS